MSHLTNPVITVALVILALVLSNAGAAFAAEPAIDPPGQEPEALAEPDTPAVPDPPDNGAEMVDPKERWSQMLANLGEHENRIHLDNVSGLEECFVELPLTETMAMLKRPERTARVARFIFIFKPWRSEIKPAPEISPEVLIAIAGAYEKKKNAKFAGYIKAVAKILYPQSPAVRKISGYVEHGGGWVLKEKMPKDLPPDLTPGIEEKLKKVLRMFVTGEGDPFTKLQIISKTVKHPKIEILKGELLLRNRKWTAAAYCFRKALEYDPAWMEAHEKLLWALCELGASNISDNSVEEPLDNAMAVALEFDPLGGRYILPVAGCAFKRKNMRKANALFRRACELDSSLGLAWLRRAQIREEAGMTDDALELVEEGIEACPNDEKLIFEKARMLAGSEANEKELEKACAAYLEAFPLGPHAKEVRKFLEDLKSRQDEEKKKSEGPEEPENKEPENPEKKEEQPEKKPDNGRIKIKAIDKQKPKKNGK
jgi:tetratricopeptide (TPR) repeat protein